MSYDFEYTTERDVDSSAVDQLFYNENEQYLVVDWKDELYRYDGVTREEFEKVANGEHSGWGSKSVGRAAQQLKASKGPGKYLGNYNETTERKVAVRHLSSVSASTVTSTPSPYAPKDLKTDSTKEYSLRTPLAPAATYEVYFNGGKSHTPSGVNSVEEAVAALEEVSKILGVNFKAEKVVVTFV